MYIVWHGMYIVWYGTVRYGMVWYGMVWYGMVWYGMVWHGMVWHGMAWYGMVWYGMVWYGMAWYGMVWFGMVWYGMVWYGMVCYGMVWYSTVVLLIRALLFGVHVRAPDFLEASFWRWVDLPSVWVRAPLRRSLMPSFSLNRRRADWNHNWPLLMFRLSCPTSHQWYGLWDQKPKILGTWTLCVSYVFFSVPGGRGHNCTRILSLRRQKYTFPTLLHTLADITARETASLQKG